MSYFELSIPIRSLIILGCFVNVCIGGYLFMAVNRRKCRCTMFLSVAAIFISSVLMIIYTAEARASLRNLKVPKVSEWLCRQSIILPIIVLILIMGYFTYLLVEEKHFRENTITRASIKEGVDKISSGLCFYMQGGRVILANSRMNEICHKITGYDLQDAELFWTTLCGGEVKEDVQRISYGRYPNFRLSDGSVWTFSREELKGFIQLTAVDITLQQLLTEELHEKNLDLAAMNLRLRKYGENVDELARANERLEAKIRIHGEMGQALLATRQYLQNGNNQVPPLEDWRRNIAMLRKEIGVKKMQDPLQILEKAAESAGVQLNIQGYLLEKAEYRHMFLLAASEALTNSVLHAGAKTLNIELSEKPFQWSMRFTNDGRKPKKAIIEGGGLSSLRRKAENIGAMMRVESFPEFELEIVGQEVTGNE